MCRGVFCRGPWAVPHRKQVTTSPWGSAVGRGCSSGPQSRLLALQLLPGWKEAPRSLEGDPLLLTTRNWLGFRFSDRAGGRSPADI